MPDRDQDARPVATGLTDILRVSAQSRRQPSQRVGPQVEPRQHLLLCAGQLKHEDETVTAEAPVIVPQPPRTEVGGKLHG